MLDISHLGAHELHGADHPTASPAQAADLPSQTKVDELHVEVVAPLAGEHDVVGLREEVVQISVEITFFLLNCLKPLIVNSQICFPFLILLEIP